MKEEELRRLELLGQKLATKKPRLQDYACNDFTPKLLIIDVALKFLPKNSEERETLQKIREILLEYGEGMWVHGSDSLTQLAIKVGSTIKKVKFQKWNPQNK